MRKLGKFMVASGASVGVVENTLTKIALSYDVFCEVVALPNILMIKVGQGLSELTDFSVQRVTNLPLHQISAMTELVDQVQQKTIPPAEASLQIDRILALPARYPPAAVIFGYVISIIGLTLLFRPDAEALLVTGIAGLMVGILIHLFTRWPRFELLLPILAAILVSAFVFVYSDVG